MQTNPSPIDPHSFHAFPPRKLHRPKPAAAPSPHDHLKMADLLLDAPLTHHPQPLIPLKKRKSPPDFQLPISSSSSMDAAPNPKRVCRICSRQFSSGRALGGHMRVHGPLFMAQSLTKLHTSELVVSGLGLSLDYKPESKAAAWHKADWGLHTALEPLTKSGKAASHGKFVYPQAIKVEEEKEESVMETFADDSELEDDLVAGAATSDRAAASRSSSDDEDDNDDDDDDDDTDFSSEGERLDSANSVVSETKIRNRGVSLSATSAATASTAAAKKNPNLYKLRDNPKKSQRFTEDEFATEMRLANSTAAAGDALMAGAAASAAAKEQTAEIRCSECGKCFWSWKALFGHMRCHPEREWRGILPPANVSEVRLHKKKFNSGHGAAEAAAMRSANVEQVESGRKREHEGGLLKMALEIEMQETAEKKLGRQLDHVQECHEAETGGARSGSVTTDDRAPRWPRGKRSRRRTSPSAKPGSEEPTLSSETTSVETEEGADPQGVVEEVSNCLFLLAEAAKRILEEDHEDDAEDLQQNSKTSAARFQMDEEFEASPAIAAMAIAEVEHEDESDNSTPASRPPVFNLEIDDAGVEPPELPLAMATGAVVSNGGDMNMVRYECTTCKKAFSSHQALGGHRASHRKMKGCFAMNGASDREEVEVGEISTVSAGADVGEEAERKLNVEQEWQQPKEFAGGSDHQMNQDNTKEKKKLQQLQLPLPGKGHECTICHRVFPSGQALGGHKRCHWTGDKTNSESASIASSSNTTTTNNKKQSSSAMSGGVQQQQQQVSNSCKPSSEEIGIDLNLPAPMDDDEEDGDEVMMMMGFPTDALQQQQQQLTGKPSTEGAESKMTNWVVAMDSRWRNQKDVSAAADSYKKFDGIMLGMPPIQFTIVQP